MTAAGVLALLLHAALMLPAAGAVAAMAPVIAARIAGHPGPAPVQAWRDARRLLRKRPALSEACFILPRCVMAEFILTLVAALLVPSFATGMATAPAADLLAIMGLLLAGRMAAALGALDVGAARTGLVAAGWMRQMLVVQTASVLAVMAIGLAAGTTNIDAAAATLRDTGGPGLALCLAVAAACCLACALGDAVLDDLSGWHAVASMASRALRRAVLICLIGTLLLPGVLAPAESSAAAWAGALAAWAVKFTVLGALLLAAQSAISARELPRWQGAAAVLAILALLLAFVRQAPA